MEFSYNYPIKLTSARAWRTYIGGKLIDKLHGIEAEDGQFPEEWLISTVVARNSGREQFPNEGMSFIEGTEVSLKEYIDSDPIAALGKKHCEDIGNITGVLVKLLDAGERLTIQAHPTKEKAMRLFNSKYGKTECWHIVDTREINGETPCIYMGFTSDVTEEKWRQYFKDQDIENMVGALHRFDVKPGETYLIRGGVPHAIGAGCLLVEIQEPTDYTIRTERITPAGLEISDFMMHQGLGFEKMFEAFEYDCIDKEEAYNRWRIQPEIVEESEEYKVQCLIGPPNTNCFRLYSYEVKKECNMEIGDEFCGIFVLSGEGSILCLDKSMSFKAGDQFFVPANCKEVTIKASENSRLFRCFGPTVQ